MKDYSDSKNRNDFILKYEIDKNRQVIYIYKANGDIISDLYSIKLEKELIKKIKNQVKKATKKLSNIDEKVEKNYKIMNLNNILIIPFFIIGLIFSYYFIIMTILLFIGDLFILLNSKKLIEIKEDIQKHELFIKKSYLINDEELRKKALQYSYNKNLKNKFLKSNVKFTINDVDQYTFKELDDLTFKLQLNQTTYSDLNKKNSKRLNKKERR